MQFPKPYPRQSSVGACCSQYITDSQITCFEVFEEKITDKEGKSEGP